MTTVDFIIPVFNEEACLARFHENLISALSHSPYSFRFFYVNDGSRDNTSQVLDLLARFDARVQPIHLTRNFGHQAALAAGLDVSDAEAVLMMDGDGEHPPEVIPEMLRLFGEGFDIVQMQRIDRRRSGTFLKSLTSGGFYWVINRLGQTRIIDGAADFRLLSREAAEALMALPEYHRFYRGMVQWIGYRSVVLPYTPSDRIAGSSKYSFPKMLRLAADGIFSFSLAPLQLGLVIGGAFLLLAFAEVIYVLSFQIRGAASSLVPGWSSLMVVLTVSSGISMLLTGILGIYTGMIFQEVKRRPIYLAKRMARTPRTVDSERTDHKSAVAVSAAPEGSNE